MYIYLYIYIYTHTHTHTNIDIYICIANARCCTIIASFPSRVIVCMEIFAKVIF